MAVINDTSGLATIAPETSAPDDRQRLDVNANQFGGQIAQAGEQLGQAGLKTADFFGEVAADNATNEYQDRATKLLHGDPTKMVAGPDGQLVQDTGYLGLKGRAALDARPQISQQLDGLEKEIRNGLQTPKQQLQFDQYSRRYRSYVDGQLGTHADTQANTWYTEVNKASGNLALNHIANNFQSDDEYLHGREDVRQAYVKQAQLQGGGTELINNALATADRDSVKARVEAMSVADPIGANKFLNDHSQEAGAFYKPLSNQLRERVTQDTGFAVADKATIDAAQSRRIPPAGQPNAQPAAYDIFQSQESGGSPNEPNKFQIQQPTFERFKQGNENFANEPDRQAVAKRFIDHLQDRYPGDVERQAVAYFSGEGNVNPDINSPTPWIDGNRKDANGKTVSSYVSDIQGKVGTQDDPNYLPSLRADAVQRVMTSTDDPKVQEVALRRIAQQFSTAQIAADQTRAAKKDASDASANTYMGSILSKKATPDTVNQIAHDPRLEWQTKGALMRAFEEYAGDPEKASRSFGDGFWDAYKQVTAPEGDPNRVGSIQPFLNRAGPNGDLTLSGVQKLNGILTELRTPEGARKSELTKSLFTAAEQKISQRPIGATRGGDPETKTQMLKFQNFALDQIDKDVAAGKPLQQIFDPDAKDGIYSSLKNFVRPRSQWTAQAVNAPDMTTSEGIFNALDQGLISPQDAQARYYALPENKGAQPSVTPQVPRYD